MLSDVPLGVEDVHRETPEIMHMVPVAADIQGYFHSQFPKLKRY
jgi:hypothetical protein